MIDSIEALKKTAVKWWTSELIERAAKSSPSILLETTHQQFVHELVHLDPNVDKLGESLRQVSMPFNLFLKHLMILADVGGEPIKRQHLDRHSIFGASHSFTIGFAGEEHKISVKGFVESASIGNKKLGVDGELIAEHHQPTALTVDTAKLILVGAFATNEEVADRFRGCDLFRFVSEEQALREFLTTRYLNVSRINQGASANALGQALQIDVAERLKVFLGDKFRIEPNGLTTVDGHKITSDLLITPASGSGGVAVEIAFQQTTNSTVERKATDADRRKADLNRVGIASCYLMDGIGIFERRAALSKVLAASDLVVNYSDTDIEKLANFVVEWC